MLNRLISLLFVITVGAGCASIHDDNTTFGPAVNLINKMPLAEARSHISDKTVKTYDPGSSTCFPVSYGKFRTVSCSSAPGHGTQIEYYASNGVAYLWYPGNSRPVRSIWRIKLDDGRYKVCAKYPTSAYNPITRQRGGNWRCEDLATYASTIKEIQTTDIFRLSTGRLPFVLPKSATTFNALLKRIGG